MSPIYVEAHGALIPDRKIFIPEGVTVHFYAKEGEYASFASFLYVLAGADMKPARSVVGPKWIADTTLSPITKDQFYWTKALADQTGLEYYAGGFAGAPLALCTRPTDEGGEPFFGADPNACDSNGHTCDGYLGRFSNESVIHMAACQGYRGASTFPNTVERLTRDYPEDSFLRTLARRLFPTLRTTPAIMVVDGEEVAYRTSQVYDQDLETLPDAEEAGRFIRLAEVDKHAAWQKFLAYPPATRNFLLAGYENFRVALEAVEKAVAVPEGGGGWLRLDELTVLRGVSAEEIHEELSGSGTSALNPSPPRLRDALNATASGFKSADFRDAGRQAGSWLGIFQDWLHTPEGEAASNVDGTTAASLINWLQTDELATFFTHTSQFHEKFRNLLDFSENMQDSWHPVTALFPELASGLASTLEEYVIRELWLHHVKLDVTLSSFTAPDIPDLDVLTGDELIRERMDQFTTHYAQLDEQQNAHASSMDDENVTAVGKEIDTLRAAMDTGNEALAVIAEMTELYGTASNCADSAYRDSLELLEPLYAVFRTATFTRDDLTTA